MEKWGTALPQPWDSARWQTEWVWMVKIEGAAERVVQGPKMERGRLAGELWAWKKWSPGNLLQT